MSKIAFLFAGQGAQYVGMGKDLYEYSKRAKEIFDMGENIRPGTLKVCFEGSEEELKRTVNTQPTLFLTDLACAAALEENGIKCSAAAGFSLGEIPALACGGILTEEEAFRFVIRRGEEMDKCTGKRKGGMAAALKLTPEKVEEICSHYNEVYPVNYNCPGQVSCAGAEEEMDAFCAEIASSGGRAVKLQVSGAFHTPFMKDASLKLKDELENYNFKPAKIPVYSNFSADIYPNEPEKQRACVYNQISNPVRWENILRAMEQSGVDTFVEVGAGKTLSGFVKRTLPNAKIYNVGDVSSLQATVSALKGE